MPARIYALAKELQIDSKELVDICKKAGIQAKNSPLASLSDSEESRLREFLKSSGPAASEPPPEPTGSAAPVSAVRQRVTPDRDKRIVNVGRTRGAATKSPLAGKGQLPDNPVEDTPAAETPVQAEAPAAPPVAEEPTQPVASPPAPVEEETPPPQPPQSAPAPPAPIAMERPPAPKTNEQIAAETAAKQEQEAVQQAKAESDKPKAKSSARRGIGRGPLRVPGTPIGQRKKGPDADMAVPPPMPMQQTTTPPPPASKPDSPAKDSRPMPGAGKKSSDAGDRDRTRGPGGGKAGTVGRGTRKRAGRSSVPAPETPAEPAQPTGPVGAVRGTGNRENKIRVIGRRADAPAAGGDENPGNTRPRPGRRAEPGVSGVKFAAMPDAPATPPPSSPKSSGGKVQAPEVSFTPGMFNDGTNKASMKEAEKQADQKRDRERGKVGQGGLSGFTSDKRRRKERGYEDEDAQRGSGGGGNSKGGRGGRSGSAGMASARADRSGRRGDRRGGGRYGTDAGGYSRRRTSIRGRGANTAAPRKETIKLELPCSLREFCEAGGVQMGQVLKTAMMMQMPININSTLDLETADLLATELGVEIELKDHETLETELISAIEARVDDESETEVRPPIITFLGHVDHGKTSLLDALIGIDVAAKEAGGITQHIRAYESEGPDGAAITFVDTPGHEAFTEMRARGANVTDIAVLVIAADDGIMPQTEEAIAHAKAAEVPIVVAMNKIDLEGVDRNRVLTQMTEHQLIPSEWGGDVEVVGTSAITGEGMDDLRETILTVAELYELKANPNREGLGVCLEARQEGDRGVSAKVIVQNGTLSVGDVVVCGDSYGKVRAMYDPLSKQGLQSAGPSTPVDLYGLDQAPRAGERFYVLDDIAQAREIAESREYEDRHARLSPITTKVSIDEFARRLESGDLSPEERARLNVIIRADTRGSLEAIEKEIAKLDHPEVEIRILQRSVGGVTLGDVTLATASEAVVLAFNVAPNEDARSLADERGIEIRRYSVIYKLADELKQLVEGQLKPEERVVELGSAVVKKVFSISGIGTIAGCYVVQGAMKRNCRIRVNRDGRTIGQYHMDSLRRIKEDVKEVPRGMECGIKLQGFNDIKQDDVLEAFEIEKIARTLD